MKVRRGEGAGSVPRMAKRWFLLHGLASCSLAANSAPVGARLPVSAPVVDQGRGLYGRLNDFSTSLIGSMQESPFLGRVWGYVAPQRPSLQRPSLQRPSLSKTSGLKANDMPVGSTKETVVTTTTTTEETLRRPLSGNDVLPRSSLHPSSAALLTPDPLYSNEILYHPAHTYHPSLHHAPSISFLTSPYADPPYADPLYADPPNHTPAYHTPPYHDPPYHDTAFQRPLAYEPLAYELPYQGFPLDPESLPGKGALAGRTELGPLTHIASVTPANTGAVTPRPPVVPPANSMAQFVKALNAIFPNVTKTSTIHPASPSLPTSIPSLNSTHHTHPSLSSSTPLPATPLPAAPLRSTVLPRIPSTLSAQTSSASTEMLFVPKSDISSPEIKSPDIKSLENKSTESDEVKSRSQLKSEPEEAEKGSGFGVVGGGLRRVKAWFDLEESLRRWRAEGVPGWLAERTAFELRGAGVNGLNEQQWSELTDALRGSGEQFSKTREMLDRMAREGVGRTPIGEIDLAILDAQLDLEEKLLSVFSRVVSVPTLFPDCQYCRQLHEAIVDHVWRAICMPFQQHTPCRQLLESPRQPLEATRKAMTTFRDTIIEQRDADRAARGRDEIRPEVEVGDRGREKAREVEDEIPLVSFDPYRPEPRGPTSHERGGRLPSDTFVPRPIAEPAPGALPGAPPGALPGSVPGPVLDTGSKPEGDAIPAPGETGLRSRGREFLDRANIIRNSLGLGKDEDVRPPPLPYAESRAVLPDQRNSGEGPLQNPRPPFSQGRDNFFRGPEYVREHFPFGPGFASAKSSIAPPGLSLLVFLFTLLHLIF